MAFDPEIHHRRSIRLPKYDYTRPGAYFVTVCTQHKECLFGHVVNGSMVLNEAGRMVHDEWLRTESVRTNIRLDAFVLMPNHFHGIVIITDSVGARRCLALNNWATHRVAPTPRNRPNSLGSIMGQFKSNATRKINVFREMPGVPVWQRNYYERIIRDDRELNRIREYIQINPLNWETDEENPGRRM